MTSTSRVSGESLLILHFLLEGMGSAGSPAKVLNEYMSNFVNRAALRYEEIFFDFSVQKNIDIHAQKMRALGRSLYGYFLFWMLFKADPPFQG
jgi:hypothetical protein